MKKTFFLLWFLGTIAGMNLPAQTPVLTLKNTAGEQEVYLQKLAIQVDVIGNIATTTMTMTFKNKTNKILEGELLFPLPEGAMVSGYALDINGKMRNAVPVPKAKATQVFEEIERRNIDPGILEKVEGNNFRTRIYPFMAQASRTITISYEQELFVEQQEMLYHLPLDYQQPIEEFSLKTVVFQQEKKPLIKESPDQSIVFDQQGSQYVASFSRNNYQPSHRLSFMIPLIDKQSQQWMQPAQGSYYFYVNQFIKGDSRPKTWSDHIGIIWDVSLSASQRDIERELQFLDEFIQRKKDVTIECTTIGYYFKKLGTFTIKNGEWSALKKQLQSLIYDGGTRYTEIDLRQMKAREYFLFSDGMSTISEAKINTTKPVHCVVSSPKADYSTLKWIASANKGTFINLNALSQQQVTRLLAEEPLLFLGIKQNEQVRELYPSIATPVQENMTIAGIVDVGKTDIVLQFGYANQVIREETIKLDVTRSDNAGIDVYKQWARKKISEMEINYEQNKEEILEIGELFGIATKGTSLMVLETLEDYIRYQITPPNDLLEEYNRRMKQDRERLKQQTLSLLDAAKKASRNLYDWWNTTFERETPKYPIPDKIQNSRAPSSGNTSQKVTLNAVNNDVAQEASWDFAQDFDEEYSPVEIVQENDVPPVRYAEGVTSLSGVIESSRKNKEEGSARNATIYISEIKQDQEYMEKLTGDETKDYRQYLESRQDYLSTPTFYFDMATWFYTHGHQEKALVVLSNIADLDIENAILFKTLAYKLKEYGQYEQEVFICKKILEWRPMDPQSYRDYGLALADAGHYQQAIEQLYKGLTQNFAQSVSAISKGIEEVLVTEINQLITLHGKALSIEMIDTAIVHSMPVDIRVVLNWNMPSTDIDLHITDPDKETCFYGHRRTNMGGRTSNDITQGFGPEQFLLKKAVPGTYSIEVNYFGDRQVKSSGPTTVMAEIYLYYAGREQERKVITLYMTKRVQQQKSGKVLVGEFKFM